MKTSNLLYFIILCVLLSACGSNSETQKKRFSVTIHNKKAKVRLGEALKVSIKNDKNIPIDSIVYQWNSQTITQTNNTIFEKTLAEEALGYQTLKATVYSDGKQEQHTNTIAVLYNQAPKLLSYRIVASYPHDPNAFTQGLEFSQDTLIESTGRRGHSSLRKVELTTGRVITKKEMDATIFAEGVTIIGDKIVQLTWKANEGYIYDKQTLEKKGSFGYNQSKEGWGLCNDGTHIYKSDGTEKIWILDPDTLAEKHFIQVTTNTGVKSKFNELEWIDGKIYANTWQKDGIAIIDPKTGALEAVINLSGLRDKVTPHQSLDVLNGIAYKADTQQLFVTGKNWDKLFEIEVIEK